MKKLLQIGLDTLLVSILPILMWITLGFILTRDIANVFSLTYPLQFFYALFEALFGKGANIAAKKMNDERIVDSNIVLGIILVGILTLLVVFNVDSYIFLMSMDRVIYHEYCIYAITWMYFSFIMAIVTQKLYFKNENVKANKINILFNVANFISIICLSIVAKNNVAIFITLAIDLCIMLIVLIKNIEITKLVFKAGKSIKYSSFSLFRNVTMFITYLIGFKTSFSFGTAYLATINVESLTTDTQWDILYSVDTVSKIDMANNKFDYKESLRNAYKLTFMLISSSIVMNLVLFWYFKPKLSVLIVLLLIQYVDMLLEPIKVMRINYLQLKDDNRQDNFVYALLRMIRVVCAFIPSVFCTYIGQFISMICLLSYALYQCRNVPIFNLRNIDNCRSSILKKE